MFVKVLILSWFGHDGPNFFYIIRGEMCKANLHCMIIVLTKMYQVSESRLREQFQGQGFNCWKQYN
jgi:hypothetical protein